MVKPVVEKSVKQSYPVSTAALQELGNCPDAYQQALDDFGINDLLSHLSNYSDADFSAALMNLEEQELESLAAILIQRLTKSLNGKLIASYLNAIRHGDSDVLCDPTNLEIAPPSLDLPADFPDGTTARYQEGDRIQWRPLANNTDWGIVIGRFYAYAQHQCHWAICYLIWLDKDSPSSRTVADIAWEEDLEPSADNSWGRVGEGENPLQSLEVNQQFNHPIPGLHPAESNAFADTKGIASLTLKDSSPYPFIHKSLHAPPGTYDSGGRNRTNPRTLTQREQNLIELYSHCKLGMTPMKFYAKWSVDYEALASICSRSISTVRRWFVRGRNYRRPTPTDLRHLAVMDFLLEHFEAIPSELLNLLCTPNPG
jgi:hypothetical protein